MTARPSDLDHGAGLVTDAAVEAAAKAQWMYAKTRTPWEDLGEDTRRVWREGVRPALEAAAPDIAAKALRDAAGQIPAWGNGGALEFAQDWLRARADALEGHADQPAGTGGDD